VRSRKGNHAIHPLIAAGNTDSNRDPDWPPEPFLTGIIAASAPARRRWSDEAPNNWNHRRSDRGGRDLDCRRIAESNAVVRDARSDAVHHSTGSADANGKAGEYPADYSATYTECARGGALHARKHEHLTFRWGNDFTDRKSWGDERQCDARQCDSACTRKHGAAALGRNVDGDGFCVERDRRIHAGNGTIVRAGRREQFEH
jgi:hypothetical protein